MKAFYLALAAIAFALNSVADDKKAPEAPPKPAPIEVRAAPAVPPVVATIDPATLKVTYKNPKSLADAHGFAEQVVRNWAEATARLQQTAAELEALKKKCD